MSIKSSTEWMLTTKTRQNHLYKNVNRLVERLRFTSSDIYIYRILCSNNIILVLRGGVFETVLQSRAQSYSTCFTTQVP